MVAVLKVLQGPLVGQPWADDMLRTLAYLLKELMPYRAPEEKGARGDAGAAVKSGVGAQGAPAPMLPPPPQPLGGVGSGNTTRGKPRKSSEGAPCYLLSRAVRDQGGRCARCGGCAPG